MIGTSVFFVNDTSVTGHAGCVQVSHEIRHNLKRRGLRIAGSWPVGFNLAAARRLYPGLGGVAAFVVNGEGTIHHTAARSRARQLAKFARKRKAVSGGPVHLINASIQDVEQRDFNDLRFYDRVFVRDTRSQRYLAAQGISSDFVPDLSLLTGDVEAGRGDHLLITDSVLDDVTGVLRACSLRQGADYQPMRPRKLRGYWRSVSQERAALLARSARYVEKIGRARAVVTGRFHAMLFCIATGTPFLAVPSNTGKVEAALMDIFGSLDRLLPPSALAMSEPVEVPPFSAAEEEDRRGYLMFARERAAAMFDQIVSSVSPAPARI